VEWEALYVAGRAAWPTVSLDPRLLEAHLARHAHEVPTDHAADYYLACACTHGNAEATRIVGEMIGADLVRAVARIDARPEFVDDALQTLRAKLLTGDSPKIATYGGKATLRKWLGTAAVRTALNMRRGKDNERREGLTSTLGEDIARGPELAFIRDQYAAAFERALRAAIVELSDRERTLLRMNVVEQLGVDRLSRVYGCGRSTVARWLAAARERVLESVRSELAKELGATPSEIESLAAALRSGLDVSMARLLA
jgi:RNA polymerase sigma-70 factor (ECF subfamily)